MFNLLNANPQTSFFILWHRFTTVWIRAAADSGLGRRMCVFNWVTMQTVGTGTTYNWQTSSTGVVTPGTWSSPLTRVTLTATRTIWTLGFWKESRSEFSSQYCWYSTNSTSRTNVQKTKKTTNRWKETQILTPSPSS